MSDVHNPSNFALKNMLLVENGVRSCEKKIKHWQPDKRTDFINNIDMNFVNELNYILDEEASTDKHVINSTVNRLGEAFTEVAKITFGTCTLNQNSVKGNVKKNEVV